MPADFDGMIRPDKNKSPASKHPRRLMTLHLHPRRAGTTKSGRELDVALFLSSLQD